MSKRNTKTARDVLYEGNFRIKTHLNANIHWEKKIHKLQSLILRIQSEISKKQTFISQLESEIDAKEYFLKQEQASFKSNTKLKLLQAKNQIEDEEKNLLTMNKLFEGMSQEILNHKVSIAKMKEEIELLEQTESKVKQDLEALKSKNNEMSAICQVQKITTNSTARIVWFKNEIDNFDTQIGKAKKQIPEFEINKMKMKLNFKECNERKDEVENLIQDVKEQSKKQQDQFDEQFNQLKDEEKAALSTIDENRAIQIKYCELNAAIIAQYMKIDLHIQQVQHDICILSKSTDISSITDIVEKDENDRIAKLQNRYDDQIKTVCQSTNREKEEMITRIQEIQARHNGLTAQMEKYKKDIIQSEREELELNKVLDELSEKHSKEDVIQLFDFATQPIFSKTEQNEILDIDELIIEPTKKIAYSQIKREKELESQIITLKDKVSKIRLDIEQQEFKNSLFRKHIDHYSKKLDLATKRQKNIWNYKYKSPIDDLIETPLEKATRLIDRLQRKTKERKDRIQLKKKSIRRKKHILMNIENTLDPQDYIQFIDRPQKYHEIKLWLNKLENEKLRWDGLHGEASKKYYLEKWEQMLLTQT